MVSQDGRIHIYSGSASASLRTYDPVTQTWSSHTLAGWSTVESGGGAASINDSVFVTDMATVGDGNTQGLIRFNLSDFSAERFAPTLAPIDVNAGLDGKLYALDGARVIVFDPATLTALRTSAWGTP